MKTTQNSMILDYIDKHGSITPMEAMQFGCMRLAARIKELRNAGHQFQTLIIYRTAENGNTVRYAKYRKAV